MRNYIIADNQELTRFALENLLKNDEENVIYRAFDRAGLVALLKEHESAIVLLDYTLFDFADEDQLLIIAERFSLSDWVPSVHTPCRIFVPSVQRGVQGRPTQRVARRLECCRTPHTLSQSACPRNHHHPTAARGRNAQRPDHHGDGDCKSHRPRQDHQGDCCRTFLQHPHRHDPPQKHLPQTGHQHSP